MIIQDSHILNICNILCKDAEVVLNREKFYSALGLSPSALEYLNQPLEVFRHAITEWMKISKESTMEELINVLNNEGFNRIADELAALVYKLDGLPESKRNRVVTITNNFDLLCKETHINVRLLLMCREDGFMTTKEINEILNAGPDEMDINSRFYKIVLNTVETDTANLDKLVARMSEKVTKQSKIVLDILM